MDPTVPSLLREVDQLGRMVTGEQQSPSSDAISQLLKATQKLCIALQKPGLLIERFLFGHLDTIILKTAVDLGIFKILVNSEKPMRLDALATSTNTDPVLLQRILQGLVSIHAIGETGDDLYCSSKVSEAFTTVKGASGINLFYHLVHPGWQRTPEFLADIKYQNPTDPSWLPFNKTFGEQPFFQYLSQHPTVLEHFNQYMTAQRDGHASWLDFFPIEDSFLDGRNINSWDKDAVMFVGIGGALGQEIAALKSRYPQLPGRMILQDLSATIDKALHVDGMEAMVHSFFTPQPIQDARVYYLRNIIHDWDDAKSLIILRNIAASMKRGYSKLLINEFVIPARGASFTASHMDLMVMALAGAMERTEIQWRQLLEQAGLPVERIWTGQVESESIIEACLASDNGYRNSEA